jgi:hypothetical protein
MCYYAPLHNQRVSGASVTPSSLAFAPTITRIEICVGRKQKSAATEFLSVMHVHNVFRVFVYLAHVKLGGGKA